MSQPPEDLSRVPTFEEALGNAARLLRTAEVTTDRTLMERYDEMASTWVQISALLMEKELT